MNQIPEINLQLPGNVASGNPDFIRPLIDHVTVGEEDDNHCKAANHSLRPEEVVILDKADRLFERGVREAIWERVEQPALNQKGGLRFQLSHAFDKAISRLPRRLSRDQSEAS